MNKKTWETILLFPLKAKEGFSWKTCLTITAIMLVSLAQSLYAGSTPGKISGKAYFEYNSPQKTDAEFSEFSFTRFYFAYDQSISKDIQIRYRLDGNRPDDHKWSPFLKHGYVSIGNLLPATRVIVGMQGTPNWSYSEPFWGYRSVEKTIQDKHKIGTSADLGIGMDVLLTEGLKLHLIYGNGTGYGAPEKDKYKKLYTQLAYSNERITAALFFDFEPQNEDYTNTTFTAFAGTELGLLSAGAEYVTRTNRDTMDVVKRGWSIFGNVDLGFGKLFGRADQYDPDNTVSDDDELFSLLGFDYAADKKVHIMPNVSTTKAHGSTETVFRMTFEFKF